MIEIVPDLPDNVVGIIATGRLTKEECDRVLKPAMEKSLRRHDRIRFYYEIGCRFPGAAWEDLRLDIARPPRWEKVAVVTDVAWVRHMVNALSFLIDSEVRVFPTLQASEGRAWVISHGPPAAAPIARRGKPMRRRPAPKPRPVAP